ncbi:MAG: radical SAM protein [Candidatus Woesearchaeota archaeon]
MPVIEKNTVKEIKLTQKQKELVAKAKKIHEENNGLDAWFGRCVFLSWYCSRGTCDFCFRSTQKHKINFSENARRSKPSIYSEALISKKLGWKLEFLTGGYDVYSFEEILEFSKICTEIFKEKIWVNLGAINKEDLIALSPYLEGVVASLETVNPILHKKTCPDKPLEPYYEMMRDAKKLGLKRGITIVLGLGETIDDYELTRRIIEEYEIERITYYALRPVMNTPYTKGPEPEDVVEWIARTRIDFPKIEIMAGTAASRLPEIKHFLDAGANGFTKLPATKIFGSKLAKEIHKQVESAGRKFKSEFVNLNEPNWSNDVEELSLNDEDKKNLLAKLDDYETKTLLKDKTF